MDHVSLSFGKPLWLALGLLAFAVAFLHRRRAAPPQYDVGAGFLWEKACAQAGARPPRPWRRPASVGVQCAAIGLLALAAADPRVPAPWDTVLVLDASAGMGAADARPTRLDEAKRLAAERIAAMPYGGRMAIVAAGEAVSVLCPMSADRARLLAALDRTPAPRGALRAREALEIAARTPDNRLRARYVVLSGGGFGPAVRMAAAEGLSVESVRVGTRRDNLALSRLAARRLPRDPKTLLVLAEVRSFLDRTVTAPVVLRLNGEAVASAPAELPPGGRWQRVFEVVAPGGGTVHARLARADDLAADDEAEVRVPSPAEGAQQAVWEAARCERPFEESGPGGPEEAADPETAPPAPARLPPPWMLLAGAAGALLVMEWGFFHRRWLD